MRTLDAAEVRNRWNKVLRAVADGEEEVLIRLKGDRKVVMLTGELYESLLGTLEVLSDPEAVQAIRRHRRGKGKTYSLGEIDRLMDAGA